MADVDSQPVDGGDMKQFARGAAAATGIDQRSNIGVARGDHTVEGSVNRLERLQLFQPFHIGPRRLDGRSACFVVPVCIVNILLRDRFGLHQILVARGRDISEV